MVACKTLAVTAGMTASAAALGFLGTDPESRWFKRLRKPDWNPPNWAFPVVWTPLYGLIAYGAARAIDAELDEAARRNLYRALALDLALNAGWCWTFFKAEAADAGLVTIVALDVANLDLLRRAARADPAAAVALTPYVAWTGFATALNAAIWRLNRS